MNLTSREIIVQNIECRCAERIGFNFNGERRDDFVYVGVGTGFTPKVWVEDNVEYTTDIWGTVWHRFVGLSQGGEVFKPVLESWDQLDSLVLPDLDNPTYYQGVRDLARSETEKFRLGCMPGWPFATCRNLRKMEVYFTDLIEHRDRIDVLHDRFTTLLEGVIDCYGNAGLDGVIFWEDLGIQDRTLMGPDMWNDIYRPLYARLTGRAHRYGMKVIQHSCGYNWALIDSLCEAGIDCLQFDQPTAYDLPALAEKLRRHRVGLFSPCDIQKILPTGDRALIERESRPLVETFRGGFIAKNYGDLVGIGVKPEWDQWAYEEFLRSGWQRTPACGSSLCFELC